MDLNEEMRQAQLYGNESKKLLALINDYLDLYSTFRENYNKVIDNLKEDYIKFFKDKGFELTKCSRGDRYFVDYSLIKANWAEGALVFELSMYREIDRDSDLKIYLKIDNPNKDKIYIDIKVNPSEYKIDINIDRLVHIKYRQGLTEVRNNVTSSKYTIEEMEYLYKAIEEDKNYLIDNINLLEDYSFIGTYNENRVGFKEVSELIDKI